jgi:hypothetical protein
MLSNPNVVNVWLGTDQQLFRFNPKKVHDLYAIQNTLYVELLVDDSFVVPYEFAYLDIDDLIVDFKAVNELLLQHH